MHALAEKYLPFHLGPTFMTGTDGMIVAASVAGATGVATLRWCWSRSRRTMAGNLLGWVLILGGALLGCFAAGAWGFAVAGLWAMGTAFGLLAVAGMTSQPGVVRASTRRVGMLPEDGEPLRIAGRVLTFVLTGPVCALLGLGIALAIRALALLAGCDEANANVSALFAMPLAWSIAAYTLLMQPRRSAQLKVAAFASLPVWPVLVAQVLA